MDRLATRRLAALVLLVTGPLLAGCTTTVRSDRRHPVYEATAYARRQRPLAELPETDFAFQSLGPVDLLNHLVRVHRGSLFGSAHPRAYTVEGVHRGWIEDRDLPGLVRLLDSTERCAPVVMATSSYLPAEASTVGREAAAMIAAHRAEAKREGYAGWPPALEADRAADLDALRAWARKHRP